MEAKEVISELEWLKKMPASTIKIWSPVTIRSFDISIEALKKRIPMKPKDVSSQKRCPVCGRRLPIKENSNSMAWFCGRCGQAIDWSDQDEDV